MARSSPKFGSVTTTPSIASAFGLEQLRAAHGFFVRLDRAMLALLRPQHHRVHPGALQDLQHLLPTALRQVIREKTAVPHNHAHRHLPLARHAWPQLPVLAKPRPAFSDQKRTRMSKRLPCVARDCKRLPGESCRPSENCLPFLGDAGSGFTLSERPVSRCRPARTGVYWENSEIAYTVGILRREKTRPCGHSGHCQTG